ncbi:uncharacterized protein LOC131256245 isoform X2 [Magnolia sinica]|nr:uncharacterized protein LOC131256245 isoform X2 [Magnolia sinica]
MTKKTRRLIDKQPDGSSGGYSGGIHDLETQLKLYDVERNKRANSTLRSCSISSQGLVSFLNTFQVYWNKRIIKYRGRLSLQKCCWRRDKVIFLYIGLNKVLMMKKRKVSLIRFIFMALFFLLLLFWFLRVQEPCIPCILSIFLQLSCCILEILNGLC